MHISSLNAYQSYKIFQIQKYLNKIMMRTLQVLRRCDIFGSAFTLRIHNNETEWRSIFGGIISLILMSISFSYIVYTFSLWFTGELPPLIVFVQESQTYVTIDKNDQSELVKFYFWNYFEGMPNPFDPQNLILMPFANWNDSYNVMILDQFDENQKFFIKDMNITTDYRKIAEKDQGETSYVTIYITLCDEQYLKEGQYCASDEFVEKFFSEVQSYLLIDYKFQKFNWHTKQLDVFYKQNYAMLELDRQYTAMIEVRLTRLTFDDGIIFQNEKTLMFPSDYSLSSQTSSTKFSLTKFRKPILFSLSIQADPIIIQAINIYPKLAEVLAQIGSIVSMVFLIQHLAIVANRLMFHQELVDSIISTYYPEYAQLRITRGIFGNITSVTNLKTRDQYDVAEFILWRRRISKQALDKMNYLSLLYDISRLYFILRHRTPEGIIQQSHNDGIPIKIQRIGPKKDEITEIIKQDKDVEIEAQLKDRLSDEDFIMWKGQHISVTDTILN